MEHWTLEDVMKLYAMGYAVICEDGMISRVEKDEE